MHITRTNSKCRSECVIDGICLHAKKYMEEDDLKYKEMKQYITYCCSFTNPMLRCPCWIATEYYDMMNDKWISLENYKTGYFNMNNEELTEKEDCELENKLENKKEVNKWQII